MSASKQKKIRNELRSEGPDKKSLAQQEAEQKNKKFKRNAIIAVVVIVVVLAAALFINSNYLYTKTTAVEINGSSYSPLEFNYYYRNAYYGFQSDYSDYFSFLVDVSKPLDEQQCMFSEEEDYTWADYFTEQALTNMTQVTALYDEAMAQGYELTEEDLAALDENVAEYAAQAETNGYTLDAFLSLSFGKGMNEEAYRAIATKQLIASCYSQTVIDGFSYTDEELAEHYAANLADSSDRLSYHVYFVSSADADFEDLADDAAKAEAAHERAAAIADASTGEEFSNNLYETLSDEDKELFQGEEYTLTDSWSDSYYADYSEWLLSDERTAGDSTVIDTEDGSYALLFLARDDNNYNMVSFRHILCKIELDENGEYTEEDRAAAEAKANLLLGMYNADPTEENFAIMAMNNSDDTGSASVGGLYENVYKGAMVAGVNDFCFAEGRESGDVEIVYGESEGSYAGYHIMYYVGDGPNFANYLAEDDLTTSDYTAYVEELTAGYTAVEGSGMNFVDID